MTSQIISGSPLADSHSEGKLFSHRSTTSPQYDEPGSIEPSQLHEGLRVSSTSHDVTVDYQDVLCKGFDILALAATFLCAIQSQVMSTTLSVLPNTVALRATNALYLSGLILDLISACLAFLTSRWFQRLTNDEKHYLQVVYSARERERSRRAVHHRPDTNKPQHPQLSFNRDDDNAPNDSERSLLVRISIRWYSTSLFIPMILLVLGAMCMIAGLYMYIWSQHPLPVAIVVTLAGAGTVPFVVGVFSIGRDDGRRKRIIRQLSKMQGDW